MKKAGKFHCACVKDKFFYVSLVLLLVCVLTFVTKGFSYNFLVKPENASQVKKVMKFINNNFLQGATSTINSVSMKDGLYYIKFSITGPSGKQDAEAYVNTKGTLLIPSIIDMNAPIPAQPAQATTTQPVQPAETTTETTTD